MELHSNALFSVPWGHVTIPRKLVPSIKRKRLAAIIKGVVMGGGANFGATYEQSFQATMSPTSPCYILTIPTTRTHHHCRAASCWWRMSGKKRVVLTLTREKEV